MSKTPKSRKSTSEDKGAMEAVQPLEEVGESTQEENILPPGNFDGESISQSETPLSDIVPAGVPDAGEQGSAVPRLSHVIEAILFASQKAVSPKELLAHLKGAASAEPNSMAVAFARIRENEVLEALLELKAEVALSGRAYQVRETASGWLLSSAAGFAPWLRALYPEAKPTRLSASALETLAIIAYRQPITRADMEAVRGVSVDGVMQTLLDRGLVKISGRAEVPGRPLLYATTQYFLDHFGLKHLDELPNASELRHLPLPKSISDQDDALAVAASAPEPPVVMDPESKAMNSESESGDPSPEGETREVTDILELRESVVMEELTADTETHENGRETPDNLHHGLQDPMVGGDPEEMLTQDPQKP